MDEKTIVKGMRVLSNIDQDVAIAYERLGPPPPRLRPKGFETFLSIIVSQQISTEVASLIMQRVFNLLPEMSAAALMSLDDQELRDTGFSWRKVEYAKGLANAIQTGAFDVDGLQQMSDQQAIEKITTLKGFGRWSAEIYLMFSLGRQDIFPADDLALLIALGKLKGLCGKPSPKHARELLEPWSPWRSVGSLFLWHYYRGAPA